MAENPNNEPDWHDLDAVGDGTLKAANAEANTDSQPTVETEEKQDHNVTCESCRCCQSAVREVFKDFGFEKGSRRSPVNKEGNDADQSPNEGTESVSETSSRPSSPPLPNGPFVTYTNIYTNKRDEEVIFKSTAYEPIEQTQNASSDREPVFDVLTTYKTVRHIYVYELTGIKTPPKAREGPVTSVVIRSPVIMDALRSVVDYYPEVDLAGDSLSVAEPYHILVHHVDKLAEYGEKLKSEKGDSIGPAIASAAPIRPANASDTAEITAGPDIESDNGPTDLDSNIPSARDLAPEDESHKHLELLLNFLESKIMADVRTERKRNSRGLVTFDMLWVLLKPGMDVGILNYDRKSKGGIETRSGAVVSTVEGGPRPAHRGSWYIKCWQLFFDGNRVGREMSSASIRPFDGEIQISRLEVIPLDMATCLNGSLLRPYLVDQGKKWYTLLKPAFKQHGGEVLEFPFHQIEAQVMVDLSAWMEMENQAPIDYGEALKPPVTVKYSNYDEIRPEVVPDLSDHQYMLCPQSLPAYFFKNRKWILVDVSRLSEPRFNSKMIDTLVIDAKRSKLLRGLSQGFIQDGSSVDSLDEEHWTADFVKGKGNSQIFLLHGPPGVGKTFTAECIAEHTQRPLMTLTTSDIGTEPADVEKNLEKNFKIAKKWGAILLIDEADIYLERRRLTDLTRNSLVAGFLRALEVYEGILFLTTNRVGSFDDAFISRIHVKLWYPDLEEDDRRKIWTNFMNKLRHDRGETMKITIDAEEYIESKKIMRLELNGREIRNIFQTAVGLAQFEKDMDKNGRIQIKKEHLAQVAEMSGAFKVYLDDVLAGNERKRAERAGLRRDDHNAKASKEKKKEKGKGDSDDDHGEEDDDD